MAGALDGQVLVVGLGNAGAQVVRGSGLALAGDVVQFAFDAHQRGLPDRGGLHQLAIDLPHAARQQEFLEHGTDGVQVILGRHVQHGVVLVVEPAVRFGILKVALHQVAVEVPVRHEVAAGIHRDEAGVLQETGIHAAAFARVGHRHRVDDVVLEPRQGIARGQAVDFGGTAARIDRAAHHHQRARCGFATRRHQRHGGQHGHGRLADADHMQLFCADVADEFLHVGHVVVQAEGAFGRRHHAGVHPVGHVHLVVAQQRVHGVAQQGGVMARQRRHHQHHRVVLQQRDGVGIVGVALEAQQPAERLLQRFQFHHGHGTAMRLDLADLPRRLFVVLADAVDEFVARRDAFRAGQVGQPTGRGGEDARVRFGHVGQRRHPCASEFVQLVQGHGSPESRFWCVVLRRSIPQRVSCRPWPVQVIGR